MLKSSLFGNFVKTVIEEHNAFMVRSKPHQTTSVQQDMFNSEGALLEEEDAPSDIDSLME